MLRAPQDESCSSWVFNNDDAGRDESHVKKLILGQLVFYRHKHDRKFGPNAAPCLFAGWRLEPGGIYRDVTFVLDLEKLRTKSGAWTDPVSVPESELYARSGDPVFPLRNAAEHALLTFADDGEVVAQDPLPIPFTPHVFTDQGERKKLRRIYITYARFRKIGPTPGCSACDNDKSNHNAECIARFEKAFGRETKAPETPAPKGFLSYEELMLRRPEPRSEGEHLSDYEPSEVGVDELPAISAVRRHQKPGALVLFQIVSHSGSHFTNVANESGVRVVSIPCDQVDFADPSVIDQLVNQVSALPGCCLCGSLFSDGWGFRQSGYGYWKAHRTLLSFLQVASVVIANGGEVVLEWPQDSTCWMLPEVQAFEDQFGLHKVSFDGCAIGLVSLSGVPYDAPWQMMTSSKRTIDNFQPFKCSHSSATKHCSARTRWPRVAHYPETLHKVLLASLFPFADAFQSPALPRVPSLPQLHRDKDSRPRIPLDVLMHESGMKEVKIPGLVHRLLDRKEWAGQPGAYEAIKKEKDDLVEVGTWLEEEIISKSDVLAWATRTSNVVHFGNLMIILSVKGSELSPDQWRLKARIVFRGDDIRDQSGMSAVFEELFASSPSSLEGLI